MDEKKVIDSCFEISTASGAKAVKVVEGMCGETKVSDSCLNSQLCDVIGGSIRPFYEWKWRKAAYFQKSFAERNGFMGLSENNDTTFAAGQNADTQGTDNAANTKDISGDGKKNMQAHSSACTLTCETVVEALSPTAVSAGTGLDVLSPDSASHGAEEVSHSLFMPLQDNYTIPITPQGPEHFANDTQASVSSLCIIMVGLPACGKTSLAQKICRLLGWHGFRATVLNVQVAWRRLLLAEKKRQCSSELQSAVLPSALLSSAASLSSQPKILSERSVGPAPCSQASATSVGNVLLRPEAASSSGCFHVTEKEMPKKLNYVTAEDFSALLNNPNGIERELYRRVLQKYAEDAKSFYDNGGDVLIVNDDFLTEELREDAEAFFSPLASQTFFIEVARSRKRDQKIYEFKVRDILEYPSDVDAAEAAEDFARRVEYLESAYTSLSSSPCCSLDSCKGHGEGLTGTTKHMFCKSDILEQDTRRDCITGDNGNRNKNNTNPDDNNNEDANNNGNNNLNSNRSCDRKYVKLSNSVEIEVHGVTGYMGSRIVSYIMNLTQHKVRHPIYFVRQGESLYNAEGRIGGDSVLTDNGKKSANEILGFLASLKEHYVKEANKTQTCEKCDEEYGCGDGTGCGVGGDDNSQNVLEIWTSHLRSATQTVENCRSLLGIKTLLWDNLNTIYAGICEDLTLSEVQAKYPLIDEFRRANKYAFRYPKGESYQDLVMRLEPVIMELNSTDCVVVVVASQSVLRALLAYFGGVSAESCVWMEVPHRTIWRCTYNSKGIPFLDEMRFEEQ